MKTQIISVVEQLDSDINTLTIICQVFDDNINLQAAIKEAIKDFSQTDACKALLKETSGQFDWGDVPNLPNNICLKHRFLIIDSITTYDAARWDEPLLETKRKAPCFSCGKRQ